MRINDERTQEYINELVMDNDHLRAEVEVLKDELRAAIGQLAQLKTDINSDVI